MPYALELYFDSALEERVRTIWTHLADAGVTNKPLAMGGRPHVSVAVCERLEAEPFRTALEAFAKAASPVEIVLATVGVFSGSGRVLFLAPIVSRDLLALHEQFYHCYVPHAVNPDANYRPGGWVPHCTLAMDLPPEKLGLAVELAHRELAEPIRGRVERTALIEFLPVRQMYDFALRGAAR